MSRKIYITFKGDDSGPMSPNWETTQKMVWLQQEKYFEKWKILWYIKLINNTNNP